MMLPEWFEYTNCIEVSTDRICTWYHWFTKYDSHNVTDEMDDLFEELTDIQNDSQVEAWIWIGG